MSDDEARDYKLDVASAIMLGVTTALTAFAAYESSLWGGEQATAYTKAITTLGDANREMLRGVQERAFDTTVWLENLKADAARNAASAAPVATAAVAAAPAPAAEPAAPAAAEPAEAARGEEPQAAEPGAAEAAPPAAEPPAAAAAPAEAESQEGAAEAPLSPEEQAKQLAEELDVSEDAPLEKQLDKLKATRRDLVGALKWADVQHKKNTASAATGQRLQVARKLIEIGAKHDAAALEYDAAVAQLGVDVDDPEAVSDALDKNPAIGLQLEAIEKRVADLHAESDKELEKLAKPMFFESSTYQRSKSEKYEQFVQKGDKLFKAGEEANTNGDKLTLATVFFTLALFFGGLASVLRHYPIKVAFLTIGTVVTIGATIYMFMTPWVAT